MPPKNPVMTFAAPWPTASRVLSEWVSVMSSTSLAVSSDSRIPTRAIARAYGRDGLQGVEVERHVGDEPGRQGVRELALVADVRDVDRGQDRERGEGDDSHEWGGDDLADAGEADDGGDADSDHRVDRPRHVEHVVDLGLEDEDGEGVDEADHDRARDEPHQLRDAAQGQDDLDDAAEEHGRDQVVVSVVAHHRGDDQGDGAGRGGDHRRAAAEEGDRDRHRERREQSDARVDAGDDREGDRLGDECESDDEAGEDLGAQQLRGPQRRPDGVVRDAVRRSGRCRRAQGSGAPFRRGVSVSSGSVRAAVRLVWAMRDHGSRAGVGASGSLSSTLPLREVRVEVGGE